MEVMGARKIRLRRVGSVPNLKAPQEDVIQKNLQPLLQYTEKKKRAQEAYYEQTQNAVGVSPMYRNTKRPVRQRLGRRLPFSGTNTSSIPPKKRLYKVNSTLNNSITKPKLFQKNYAQMRLNKIRENQRQQLHLSQLNLSTNPKRLKLRRIAPNSMLRVEVRNNNVHPNRQFYNNQVPGRHRQVLDDILQEEIRQLQCEHDSVEIIFSNRFKPVTTTLTMHDRFGRMS